eukprot:m.351652 g.351652  ORF g.351652 m.351652 type:complete len:57 (+) comp16299_c0_seq1:878-1048(+)
MEIAIHSKCQDGHTKHDANALVALPLLGITQLLPGWKSLWSLAHHDDQSLMSSDDL